MRSTWSGPTPPRAMADAGGREQLDRLVRRVAAGLLDCSSARYQRGLIAVSLVPFHSIALHLLPSGQKDQN
jgi:hypothetical protein